MRTRRPARLTLMILNALSGSNEPLAGDLLEEFDGGRSQWWLLGQVLAAAAYEIGPSLATMRSNLNTTVLGVALLGVASLEVVIVANVVGRLTSGPSLDPSVHARATENWALPVALAIVVSTALGSMFARFHDQHRQLSVALLTTSVFVSATLTIEFSLIVQLLTTAIFIAGLIAGGRFNPFRSSPLPAASS